MYIMETVATAVSDAEFTATCASCTSSLGKYALIALGIFVLVFIGCMIAGKQNETKKRERQEKIASSSFTPQQFFAYRKSGIMPNVPGVYIIRNITNGKNYVGQAQNVSDRINQHFTGRGNGDVYADYKYGQEFLVSIVPFANSGYYSLNDLERAMIELYDAYELGYNRTRGNK